MACSEYTVPDESPYVLPYAVGARYLVLNTTGHGQPQLYAIDFIMPIGTAVTTARSGVVVAVRAGFADSDHTFGHENLVWIRHDDGTVARYYHLTKDGVLVSVGSRVTQGQEIGLSGNSGHSDAPHLHFDVASCVGGFDDHKALPCGQTLPVTFRNAENNRCGLLVGTTYLANTY